jgi:hypothetical protein
MTAPPGAQISDDGNYWWDGTEWQAVAGGDADATATSTDTDTSATPLAQSVDEVQTVDQLEPDVAEEAQKIQEFINSDPGFAELESMDVDALLAELE